MTETDVKKPWYRYKMVWMLIAIPLSSVIVCTYLIYQSVVTFDGMVEDDYYKKGKEINMVLARDKFSVDNGIGALVDINAETGMISAEMSVESDYQLPDQLSLMLLHPTRSNKDQKMLLNKGPDGRYFSALRAPLDDGRWYIRIVERNFRLTKLVSWPFTQPQKIDPI